MKVSRRKLLLSMLVASVSGTTKLFFKKEVNLSGISSGFY